MKILYFESKTFSIIINFELIEPLKVDAILLVEISLKFFGSESRVLKAVT